MLSSCFIQAHEFGSINRGCVVLGRLLVQVRQRMRGRDSRGPQGARCYRQTARAGEADNEGQGQQGGT